MDPNQELHQLESGCHTKYLDFTRKVSDIYRAIKIFIEKLYTVYTYCKVCGAKAVVKFP
jgi:hypothetical protein